MYKVITKVAFTTKDERKEFKRIACIVIYGELIRYMNSKNTSNSNVA